MTGRAFHGQEQAQDPEWWSEEDLASWSKGKKGKKDFSKSSAARKKAQARISHRTRAEERTKKEKARKALILTLDFQLLKHPVNKDMAMPGNQMTWSASHWPDQSST